ncbi:hypothetical protein OHA70_01405 [Kribbella sp. NBC_00382]|uniref:hypothetical protein n=1 Tax=Kribbella sp. NBC_00382 TaxID=2975967 RepID=UPI002E1E8340
MPRRVLAQGPDGSFDLVEVPAESEKALQEIVKLNPQLIPSDDLGLDGDLLVVGRETSLASGAIDLLCLARSGDLVLIEFKTGPQNPDFRAALAQLIDYGSDLWGMTLTDFDNGVVQRYLSGGHVSEAFKGLGSLAEAVSKTNWELGEEELGTLNARLTDVLANGDFRFVVAAQRFTPAMIKSLQYLNATARYGQYSLVQVIRMEGSQLSAYSAQVVSGTARSGQTASSVGTGRTNEANFLAGIADDEYRDAMKEVLAGASALGLVTYWGAKGASLRVRTPDRAEPVSIAWAFLEGDQWFSARHLSLGVDRETLAQVHSVQPAIEAFVQEVSQIPGAKPVPSKLDAYMFEPAIVPRAKASIIAALEHVVAAVRALGDEPPSRG